METDRKFRSEAAEALHELASDLHGAGLLDRATMRNVDFLSFVPARPFDAQRIRALRDREGVSQTVFAAALGVTKNLVSDWERGVKKPGGPARRLLEVVEAHGLGMLEPARGDSARDMPAAAE